MTDREKAIVMAYTGTAMLVGDKFSIYHKYIEDICGRPIYTHEIAFLAEEIKEKSRADFIELCREEARACDCISRQDLLKKRVYAPIAPIIKGDSVHYEDLVFARDIINAEPIQKEPKTEWISVSERLPEDIKPVIVTYKNNDPESYYQHIAGKHFIGVAHYLKGKWFWYSSTTEDFLAEYGRYDGEEFDEAIEVVAWQPLPPSYQGE